MKAIVRAAAAALVLSGTAEATVRPYLVDVTSTTARIRFSSDQSPNSVEWGVGALTNSTPVTAVIDNELDTLFQQALVEVQLTGLSASTVYQYRVVRGALPDATYTFTTAVNPGEAFSFAAYGDNRTGVGGVAGGGAHADHKAVADAIAAQVPDFVVNTADHMDTDNILGDDIFQPWDDFFLQEQNLLPKTPTYNARGNHDDAADFWVKLFSIPGDPGVGYRSFDYGNAHFVVVNTNESVNAGSPQYNFIQADLAANEGQGPLFAFHHHGAFSNGVHGGSSGPHDHLAPLYQRYGVDVVFTGHDHVYTRYQPINGVNYVVTGGGGAPTYPVNFQNQAPIVVTQSTLNYVLTTVSGDAITVVARRPNGTQIDAFAVNAAANDGLYTESDPLPPKGDGVSVPGCITAGGPASGGASGAASALLYGLPVLAIGLLRRRA
ncbi:MAG: metallophosphoesterase family protein [Candidatus Methylomirabilis sp.]|nr:metallophosphoesterase family protein [Deltaproteobacteria bacterium]